MPQAQERISKSARGGAYELVQFLNEDGEYGDYVPRDKAMADEYVKKDPIAKADFQLSELTSNGGVIVDAQAKSFFKVMIEEAVMLKEITVSPMRGPTERLDKVSFPNRIMRPGTDRQQLSAADRSAPTTSKVSLATKEIVGEVRLGYQSIEDNIEGESFINTVKSMLAERAGVDLEELYISGDTTSSDTYLKLLNGILKAATTNTVAGGTVTITRAMLKAAVKAIPKQFLRQKKNMRFLTSTDAEADYRDLLADRGTVVGDRFLVEDAPVMYSGIPLVGVPMFPDNLGGGTNETNVVLTDPKNIHAGVQRQMNLEWEKDISARDYKFVLTMRTDMIYEHEPAVVKITAVKTQ